MLFTNLSAFPCANLSAGQSLYSQNIFLWIICRSALITEPIYFCSSFRGSLKLFLSLYQFLAHLRNKFFCFLTFNFYLLFPPRVPYRNVGLAHFQLLGIFPRNFTERFWFVLKEEVRTVWEQFQFTNRHSFDIVFILTFLWFVVNEILKIWDHFSFSDILVKVLDRIFISKYLELATYGKS